MEQFVGGVQTMGVIAYYLPEAIAGGQNWPEDPLIWTLGSFFLCMYQ